MFPNTVFLKIKLTLTLHHERSIPCLDSLMHEKEKNLSLEERVELTLKDIQSM